MARETLEQYRILVQKSPVAMLISSGPDEMVVMVNDRFTDLFGYTIEDIPDVARWWPLAYPDEAYRDEVRLEWKTKVEWARWNRVDIEPLEARVTCRDGSHRHIKFHLSPIGDTAGNLVTFFDVTERRRQQEAALAKIREGEKALLDSEARSITEQSRTAQALRESEERYRGLFEDSRDMIVITTPEGKFLNINQAGVEMLGFDSREEVLRLENIATDLYLDPLDREQMLSDMQKSGFLKEYSLKFKTRNGGIIDLSATLTPVLDADGQISAIRGILRDMTAHNRLEEQLRQSQRLESIGVLAGGVAHEFNNKLTAIQGNIDLALMETPRNSPVYEELTIARKSCEQAADIIRQLLVFSRHETMQPKSMDLNSVIRKTAEMLGRIIGEQYELVTILEEDVLAVYADATHVEQVIVNLVINARDAMPGGGRITVKSGSLFISEEQAASRPGSRPGETVHFSVSDTGTGIDPKFLPHIFEPFFSTKNASEGGGLGLSVVYGIVADHKGWISVDSSPDRGTTIDVLLPAAALASGG